jgi:hypothetical protein
MKVLAEIHLINRYCYAVLLNPIGFNAVPDPAFFLSADPGPDPGQTFKHFNFYTENKLKVGKRSKT